jgi:glycosyltransferase involved in cell wall biosynthesis
VKVAICHQVFSYGDAIGNDMAGMYRLLQRLGMEPVIVCDWNSQNGGFRISAPAATDWKSFEIIIYHHSLYWELGEELIFHSACPIVFKHHNITPPRFFEPYSEHYYNVCAQGREQTKVFAADKRHVWLSDSHFSKEELVEAGVDADPIRVVPPFNRVGQLLPLRSKADYSSVAIELLFVGRIAPNKGHLHLLRVACVLMSEFSRPIKARIVGALDPALDDYYDRIVRDINDFGLFGHVEVLPHCGDNELIELYRRSHLYVCLSEHEGFNVPIIEAQAVGLPVLGAGAGATGETAGPGQLFAEVPRSAAADYFYASLIEEVFTDRNLRAQLTLAGEHNVRERFTDEVIENAFISAIYESINHS